MTITATRRPDAAREPTPDAPVAALPDAHAVEQAIADHLRYIREVERIEPTAEAVCRLRNDLLLQFHHGGRPVLCRRTPDGVIVLAAGTEAVFEAVRRLPPDRRSGFVIEYPDPWAA